MGRIKRILNGGLLNWRLAKLLPETGLCVVIGGIGSGKSCLCYGILEYLHYFRPDTPIYVYGFPRQREDILPEWIRTWNTPDFPEGSIVLGDEAYLQLHSRQSMSKQSRFVDRFAGLVRQKGIFGLFVTQTLRKLDVGVLSSAQLLMIKRVPYLQTQLDRCQLRPKLIEVAKHFAKVGQNGYNPLSCTYVIHSNGEEMIHNSNFIPSFWSDELSRPWAGVSLKEQEEEE